MITEFSAERTTNLAPTGQEHVRHLVKEACEPIAQFWPMKDFVHHNPLHGLEHLPFDTAIREAKHLLGGEGYLSNHEYRESYRKGRITPEGLSRALLRLAPRAGGPAIQLGSRRIEAMDVWRIHLLFGIEPLEPGQSWKLSRQDIITRFQEDLPAQFRDRILGRCVREGETGRNLGEDYLKELWESALQVMSHAEKWPLEPLVEVALPGQRTVGDWLDLIAGASIVEKINDQMSKWVAAFVDEGMAVWAMPGRDQGFYLAWRDLAAGDFSGRFLGIRNFSRKLRSLPSSAEDAITLCLRRLEVPPHRWTEYLTRHVAQLPGWAGYVRWRGANPSHPAQAANPIDPLQYLAVRLFYEAELADAFCRREWNIPGTATAIASRCRTERDKSWHQLTMHGDGDNHQERIALKAWKLFRLAQFLELMPFEIRSLGPDDAERLLGWLDRFPEDQHGPVWLEAYEDRFRESLITKLAGPSRTEIQTPARLRAQIIFCIDVRSESMRRHIEAQGYETFGFAGFFGVTMNHRAFDSTERFPLCPVLLKASIAVDEVARPGNSKQAQRYASGTRWWWMGDHLIHDLKQNPIASFLLVDLIGFLVGLGLIGKTLLPRVHQTIKRAINQWFHPTLSTRIAVNRNAEDKNGSSATGFTREEQANMVEGALRAIGLTRNFARFIVPCGHGSVSDNNPYFAALHCGACGGKHGDPSARAFAAMGNDPEVRRLLRNRGLDIPDDTWFLGAKHITTSDRIAAYDVEDVPASHREDLNAMLRDWERAGAAQALERCTRLPRARFSSSQKAYRHVDARTMDWANTRPEWGLSSNAAFLIGRRSLSRDVSLDGRVFLHSYDPEQDTEGKILEKIMTAPLIVGEWINMEHYFSAVDPWFWGCGSKVIHNVAAGVGVIAGSQGDLQTGLSLQTVNDGASHFHEPMRLLTVIEAPISRISPIIRKHGLLQELFHNQWVNLVAVDSERREFRRYNPDGMWERIAVAKVQEGIAA
jgi:uncharacterized protein